MILFTLLFLLLILLPGYVLTKIFKINFGDFFDQIIYYISLGFVWNSFVALIAILTSLNIVNLTYLYIIDLIILATIHFIFNRPILKLFNPFKNFPSKNIFLKENYLFPWAEYPRAFRHTDESPLETNLSSRNTPSALLRGSLLFPVLLFIFFILYVVVSHGSIFEQEAFFHISIIRKVVDGASLSPSNLNLIKSQILHSVYALPVWHVFLGFISYISKLNIVYVWTIVALPLSMLSITIWAWLLRQIMPSKTSLFLSLGFFTILVGGFDNGYLFTRLAVPNTLGLLLLLPLALGLVTKYIFNEKKENKLILILFSLLFVLALIHILQVIYFFLILIFTTLTIFIIKCFDPNFKEILPRILKIFLINLGLIILIGIFAIIFEKINIINFKNLFQISQKQIFDNSTFNNLNIISKISYILFPLLLLFINKNKSLIIIFSIFSILPILFLPFLPYLGNLLYKTFGSIFFYRIDAYTNWNFAFFGIILSVILILINKFLTKLSHFWLKLITISLIAMSFLSIFLEYSFNLVGNLYENIFSNIKLSNFLNSNYWLLLLIIIGVTILILIWQKGLEKKNIFDIDSKLWLTNLLISFIIFFFFFSPLFNSTISIIRENEWYKNSEIENQKISPEIINPSTINFIKNQIPPKSVFFSNDLLNDVLPLLTDNFVENYPRSNERAQTKLIFTTKISDEEKLNLIKKYNIEYVLLSPDQTLEEQYFNDNTNVFKKIYDNKELIYKVN